MTIFLLLDTRHSSQQEQSKIGKIVTFRTTRGGRRVPSARVESTTVASAVSIPRNHGLINYKDNKLVCLRPFLKVRLGKGGWWARIRRQHKNTL